MAEVERVERHEALSIAQHMQEVLTRFTAIRSNMVADKKITQAHIDAMDKLRTHIDAARDAAEKAAPMPSLQDPPVPVSGGPFDMERDRPGVKTEQASKESESTIIPDAERQQRTADAQRDNVLRGGSTVNVEAGHGRQAGEDPRGLQDKAKDSHQGRRK